MARNIWHFRSLGSGHVTAEWIYTKFKIVITTFKGEIVFYCVAYGSKKKDSKELRDRGITFHRFQTIYKSISSSSLLR